MHRPWSHAGGPVLEILLALGAATSCQSQPRVRFSADTDVTTYTLTTPHLFASPTEGLLTASVDIAVGPSGTVYVLDADRQEVIGISPEGRVEKHIGSPGQGAGELVRPMFMALRGDTLRVYDYGGGQSVVYARDGRYARSFPTILTGAPNHLSFGPGDTIAYSTFFSAEPCGLVTLLDPRYGTERCRGELVSKDRTIPPDFLDLVRSHEMPGFMRNHSLPVFGSSGDLWIFLETESVVLHYDTDGALLTQAVIAMPEALDIRAEYFDWYAGISGQVMRAFNYASEGTLVNGALWLLWNTPLGQPGLITVHDEGGRAEVRLALQDMDQIGRSWGDGRPNRRFGVDIARRRLYLLDTRTSTVMWFALPQDLL